MTTFAMRKLLMRKNKDQHYYKLIRDDDWKQPESYEDATTG